LAVELLRFRSPLIQRMFYRISGAAMRPEEEKKMTGATYMVAAAFICSVVFIDRPYISFMVLCSFIWGDAAAALTGQSIGRIKIGKKSLEGSAGCFILCMTLFLALFPHVPHLLDNWNNHVSLAMTIAASLCITVMELFPITIVKKYVINDNLTVPVFTGIVMQVLYPIIH
jgi:dolichol kinase